MHAMQQQSDTVVPSGISLSGNSECSIQDGRVMLTIDQIASQRDIGNLSGTLAVELWALKQPYSGEDFSGIALAGTSIGELWGQHFLSNCRYDLIFQEPPAGSWNLVLMLREWTEVGYVTRDHVNFSDPYVVSARPAVVRDAPDNVIKVDFAPNSESSVKEAVPHSAPAVSETSASADARGDSIVSLNEASLKSISAIHGMSKKVAERIVDSRPFESFDQLLKVKGIGPALLRKIRKFMTL